MHVTTFLKELSDSQLQHTYTLRWGRRIIFEACVFMPPAPRNSLKSEEVVRDREKSLGAKVLEGSWGCLGALWDRFIAVLGARWGPWAALGVSWGTLVSPSLLPALE